MDAIESLDWGVVSNFGFTLNNYPKLLLLFKGAYYLGSYTGAGAIVIVALAMFLRQRSYRAALATAACFALAVGVFEVVRFVVPRRRPEDAQNLLGADGMLGSYPSSVMLFMLSVNLLGCAVWDLLPAAAIRRRSLYALLATLLTVWVCLSHMYLRIHFFSDVLGGLAAGALFSWLGYRCIGPSVPKPVWAPADGAFRAGEPPRGS